MPTTRSSDANQTKKKTAVKMPRPHQRPSPRRTDVEEGHMGAMESQMVPTRPPTSDDDEPKQG